MNAELRHAIGLLRLGNLALTEHLVSLASTNPHILVRQDQLVRKATNWLDMLIEGHVPGQGEAPEVSSAPQASDTAGAVARADHGEIAASPASGLLEHVFTQIGLMFRTPAELRVAHAFAEALEPSGWLSCGTAEIARSTGCSQVQAEAVLERLQQGEPAGLFARSLAECLRLQAIDLGLLTADFALLLDNLPVLGRGDLGQLMQICGCDADRLTQMLRALRGMNPKPGAVFDHAAPIREPDLIVRRGPEGWLVELNRSTLPAVEIRDAPGLTNTDTLLRDARLLQRAVARRNVTTLRIAQAVISRQGEFLAKGPAWIKPLGFSEVADMIEVHQSTVSRVTSDLLVAAPRGTFRFRDFFSAGLETIGGEPRIATGAVLHALGALIAAEDPANPLKDEDIALHFHRQGIPLARRTIAKYRGRLNIPASHDRKGKPRGA